MTHGPKGHLLLEGRSMLGELHRLCLAGEPEGVSMLIGSGIDLPYAVSIMVKDQEIERLGRSTRELRKEEHAVRVVSGVTFGIGC